MADLEAQLLMANAPRSYRDKCLNSIANATSQCKLTCLALAWTFFVITGYVLVMLALFQFITIQLGEQNSNSAMVSLDVLTGADELLGTWDLNLYFNKGIQEFEYKASAWVFSDGEFVSLERLKGQDSLVQGTFMMDIEDDFSRDKGITFDLLVEAEVTIFSKFRCAKTKTLLIDCSDLKITFPLNKAAETRTLSKGAQSCKVSTSPSKFVI